MMLRLHFINRTTCSILAFGHLWSVHLDPFRPSVPYSELIAEMEAVSLTSFPLQRDEAYKIWPKKNIWTRNVRISLAPTKSPRVCPDE